ncbi:TPA: phage capsid protein [Streptococcus agalactiae]|nr:phage capsid protein [Streptococcus agalactiae]
MAENNLNTMADLGDIRSIDFVNKFSTNINELLTLLGVTRKEELTSDLKIQTYKWTVDLKAENPAEGETIPLSKVTRTKDKDYVVSWFKKRRATTAEAIARHGVSRAISEADTRVMREIQNGFKKDFFTFLKTNPTKVKGVGLQKALSQSWAKLATFEEFEGSPIVSFVSPMDVANYLGDTKVGANASNVFGMTLLKNFLGMQNVIVLPSVPEGKVYSTAVENLVFAYLNVNGGDLGGMFADFTDETGLIGAGRQRQLSNLTYESVFFGANVLFAEIPAGVVEATIDPEPVVVPGG